MDNELVEAVAQLRSELQRWLEIGPDNQPHFSNGMRPFSTGDLKAFVQALATPLASLKAENEALRQWVEDAYLEGYSQGMVAGTLAGREDDWAKSKARAALTKQGG